MNTIAFIRFAGIDAFVELVELATLAGDDGALDTEETLPMPGSTTKAAPAEGSRPTWFGRNWDEATALVRSTARSRAHA